MNTPCQPDPTKSNQSLPEVSATSGELNCAPANSSIAPEMSGSCPTADGSALPGSSRQRKLTDAQKLARSLPLTDSQTQMVLGTLLGDACLTTWRKKSGSKNPAYCVGHGTAQGGYCRRKAEILQNYVRSPVRTTSGRDSSLVKGSRFLVHRLNTLSSPSFQKIRKVCYSGRTPDGRDRKLVTKEWVSLLTWEGVAWWYMDDGCLQGHRSATFCTQGFSRKEVNLLIKWLQEHGVSCKRYELKSPVSEKIYWIIKVSIDGTRVLLENTRPWMFQDLAYKWDFNEPIRNVSCAYCGTEFTTKRPFTRGAVCDNPECRRVRRREIQADTVASHSDQIKKKRYKKYRSNLEESRRAGREYMRAWMSDPVNRKRVNDRVRQHEAYEAVCAFCSTSFTASGVTSKTRPCCQSPACKEKRQAIWVEEFKPTRRKTVLHTEVCTFCHKEFQADNHTSKTIPKCQDPECIKECKRFYMRQRYHRVKEEASPKSKK